MRLITSPPLSSTLSRMLQFSSRRASSGGCKHQSLRRGPPLSSAQQVSTRTRRKKTYSRAGARTHRCASSFASCDVYVVNRLYYNKVTAASDNETTSCWHERSWITRLFWAAFFCAREKSDHFREAGDSSSRFIFQGLL